MALEDRLLEETIPSNPGILRAADLLKGSPVGADATAKDLLAPRSDWREMGESEHFVQLYESEDALLSSLSGFIGTGLQGKDACIVLARKTTTTALEERLLADGVDPRPRAASGHYVVLDASDSLQQFMRDGVPDPRRFRRMVEKILSRLPKNYNQLRIFGEMVAVLCADGHFEAAIRLKRLWTDLQKQYTFSLFCAYPVSLFASEKMPTTFGDVCSAHSRVIPAESYTDLLNSDDRLRAIARLQQRANSLEAEVAQRKAIAARFRFLAEAMPQKVFIAKPDGVIEFFNGQWTEFTGLLDDQIAGWADVAHPDDLKENLPNWQRSIASGEPFHCEHRIRRYDGIYQWHLTSAQPMHDLDGHVLMWVGSTIDIDDRKRTEEALHESEIALNSSLRLRDEFLSGVSHDLKTPLAIVKGQAQLLQRRIMRGKLDDESLLEGLDQIEAKARVMTDLIDELLDVTRLRAGEELELDRRTVDLVALVQDVVGGLQQITERHHLEFRTAETHLTGLCDQVRLRRVIGNLMSNALKYSPDGGNITVTLTLERNADLDRAVLTVTDQGMGIPGDDLPHIFDQFYRGSNAKNVADGTGLGLTGVKHIVEQHGGTIEVQSQEGVGSTFTVRLPL